MSVLIGEFDKRSQDYLNRLTGSAPAHFLEFPKVYLSCPKQENVSELLESAITVCFAGNETLFNPETKISEFDVFVTLRHSSRMELGAFTKVVKGFRPYFCWILDPNRSQRVIRYCIALANAMANDKIELGLNLVLVDERGETARHFNRSTLDAEIPKIP